MAQRSKGIVIPISSTDDTGRAFASVNGQVSELRSRVASLQAQLRGGGPGAQLGEGMHGAVPQVAAASGAIREFEGALPIRAMERFLTTTLGLGPILQAAFPIVGAVAFVGIIGESIKKLVELYKAGTEAPEKIRRAFQEMNLKLQEGVDELDLAIAKARQELDKLEGHHNDGGAVALAAMKVEADKLYDSLSADLKAMNALVKEQEVGLFKSLVSGQGTTTEQTNEIAHGTQLLQDRQRIADQHYQEALTKAGNNQKAQRAAEDKYHKESNDAFDAFIKIRKDKAKALRDEDAANKAPLDKAAAFLDPITQTLGLGDHAATDFLQGSGTRAGDKGAAINVEEGAAQAAEEAKARFNRTGTLGDLQNQIGTAKGAKSDADAEKKAEAERRAKAEADEKTAAAARDLADANARALAAKQKAGTDTQLDELESAHRALLVSDEDYYKRREAIQAQAIANQRAALAAERADLQGQAAGAQASGAGLTGNDKTINDARIVELRAKIVDLDIKDAQLTGQAANNTRARADAETELSKRRLATADSLAAQLEGERGGSVEARSKQSRDQYTEKRAGLAGAPAAVLADLDSQQGIDQDNIAAKGAEQDLGAGDVQRQVARKAIADQLARGQISAQQAQKEKIALDREEADAMQPLLAAYRQLAADGDLAAVGKVAELQQKIAELKTPVNEVAAEIRSQLDSAFEGFFENLQKGRGALKALGQAIQKDASKDLYQQFIRPGIQSAEGILVPNKNASKLPDGSGVTAAAGGLLGKVPGLAGIGSKGKGAIKVEIINQGGDKVQEGSASIEGFESDFEDKIIHIVLKNASEGGPMSKLLG